MFSPDEPDRYAGLVHASAPCTTISWYAADFDAYYQCQRAVAALWRQPDGMVADEYSEHCETWAGSPRTARFANTPPRSGTCRRIRRPETGEPGAAQRTAGGPARRTSRPSSPHATPIRSLCLVHTPPPPGPWCALSCRMPNALALLLSDGSVHGKSDPPRTKRVSSSCCSPMAHRNPGIACGPRTKPRVGSCATPMASAAVLGPLDDHLLVEGTHQRLYERLGAHPMRHEGAARRAFRGLGAACACGFRWWAISMPGTAGGIRCANASTAACGKSSSPAWRQARSTNTKSSRAMASVLPLKADPFGFAAELRPSTASVVGAVPTLHVGTMRRIWRRRAEGDPRRKPMSIYEVHLGSWQRGADGRFLTYDELAEPAGSLCRRHGLHPSRTDAGHRTSARRFLGLSADRPVRADAAGLAIRPASPASSTGPTRPASASSSTGCRRIFPPTRMAWRISTARRSTNTPIRAGAFTPTGTPRSTISAAARWPISCIANALFWLRALSHRRAARRCRRLDALSRLFAQPRRMAAEPRRRATTTATPSRSCGG